MGASFGDGRAYLKGRMEYALRNAETGEIVQRGVQDNTVVTAGRSWGLLNLVSGQGQSSQVIGWIAAGTDTTAPATGDSGLGSELTRIAVGTFTTTNATSNPPSVAFIAQFATNEANGTLAEFGLFNSSASGTMFNHVTNSVTINKTTSNTLDITMTISN